LLLLDTDILIDFQRGFAPAVEWFRSLSDTPSIPGLVAMELIQDARDSREVERSRKLAAPFDVVWPSEADCTLALEVFRTHHFSHNLGLIDSLIGATALGLDATLCTFNDKHYRVIPGLQLSRPCSR
jgi:predicted nucleic acid-binding protein